MARPTTKEDLLEASNKEYTKMIDLIENMSIDDQNKNFNFEDRDRNIRDVLMHLHHWHQLMDEWYIQGVIEKEMFNTPGHGYTWRTLSGLNQELWEKGNQVTLEEAKKLLNKSHDKIETYIKSHTNEELFSKNQYPFTKSTTLGSYFVSNTCSHYLWAQKKIKNHIKSV